MQMVKTLRAPSDRTLNRLIKASILVLVIGIPLVGVVYVMDRYVAPGPTLVERRTEQLEDAVKKAPSDVDARLLLVGAYLADKREVDALAQLNEILRVQPNHKNALLARGSLFQQQGNLDAAATDYQAIVDEMKGQEFAGEDKELAAAYYGLGQIAVARGKPAEAVTALTSALQIDRTNADTLNVLGAAYLASGDPTKAIDALRRAVEFVPTDWAEPYQSLAAAYAKVGNGAEAAWATAMSDFANRQPDKAKQELTTLVAGPAATDAYLGLGMIAETQADSTAAAAAYRKVLARDPQNFNAQAGLSRVTDPSTSPSAPASSAPAAGGNG